MTGTDFPLHRSASQQSADRYPGNPVSGLVALIGIVPDIVPANFPDELLQDMNHHCIFDKNNAQTQLLTLCNYSTTLPFTIFTGYSLYRTAFLEKREKHEKLFSAGGAVPWGMAGLSLFMGFFQPELSWSGAPSPIHRVG